MEGSGDGVWDWNIQTHELKYSDRWLEMLGYAVGDLLPIYDDWSRRIHPEDQSLVAKTLQAYLSGEADVYVVEYRLKCKDESYRWLLARGILVSRSSDGKPLRMLGTHTDISTHKQAEQVLAFATLEAKALAQTKANFLSNMSHEIRTPMSAIIGLSQLALDVESPAKIRDYLKKIHQSSYSLLDILNDILDFSKLEAGRMVIEHADFNLDELLSNISNLFVNAAQEKNLDFTIELAANIPRYLIGDRLKLQQILINLVANAIKFTEQGSVTLNVTTNKVSAGKIWLLFGVSDTGIGILDTHISTLFQPFSQADASITRRFGGTGLGLAISHDLLKLMGSEFSVVSSPGLGSCFSFELMLDLSSAVSAPIAVSSLNAETATLSVITTFDQTEQSMPLNYSSFSYCANELDQLLAGNDLIPEALLNSFKAHLVESQHGLFYQFYKQLESLRYDAAREILCQLAELTGNPQQSFTNTPRRQPTILIVDDVPTNVFILAQALNGLYRIKVAINGVDTLKIAQREQPDLILLDVMMPDMDGFEVCRQLKACNRTAEIAVIFVTAKSAEFDETTGLDLGAADYISKPYVIPIIKARVRTQIRLKQLLDALHLKDSALNVVANSILITDVEGVIEWANPAYCSLTGYSLDEVQGLNPRELVKSGQQNQAYYKIMWDTILANKSWRGELVNRRKDKSLYNEEMTITPLTNSQGKITHFVAIKQEITERMATTALKLINSLETARRRISSELHDRTSPNLAAINLNLNIISQELPQEHLLNISERIEDTWALIADTEISIREICADMRPPLLDYAGLAEAIRSYAEQFAQRTGIMVRFNCVDHDERYAPILESLLFRIVQEALTNCLKYAEATRIIVTLSNGGHPITLTVTDNGSGFDLTSLRQDGHVGLGLLNMREMTEMNNGRFFIQSALGKGTRVRVKIL